MPIELESMAIEINKALQEYSDNVAEKVDKIIDDVAKETIIKLKETSPKKTGKYSKSWRITILYDGKGNKRISINNKIGHLTHLLENGHALKKGGRVRAFPHIRPAEQWAIKEVERRIEEL